MKQKVTQLSAIETINLALDTLAKEKQALIFVGTRPSAEKTAEEVARKIDMAGNKERVVELAALANEVLHALESPTRQCERLARCVRKGVAFHHSGLVAKQRQLIEDNFRLGKIKIISCTPTLAAGVDLPAYRAIIRDVKRFTQHGYDFIPVLEYLQMAGRAGRPNYDSEGQAIILAQSEMDAEELDERFIQGEPEEIFSKLAVEPVLRTYVLSLIATRLVRSKEQLMNFFASTFWAHQFKDMSKLEMIINRMIALLESWDFIEGNSGDFVSAADLENSPLAATALGRRVAQLYLDPLTAHNFIEGLKLSKHRGVSPFALLQLISYATEMQPLLKVRAKEFEDVQEKLNESQLQMLTHEPSAYDPEYEDYLSSVKTAMFFEDWISENTEEVLLEKYNIRPGEIRAKLDNGDWLLYGLLELAKVLNLKSEVKEIMKLRVRIKYGVHEELLPLLQLKGIGRVRSRMLFNHKIRSIADIKNTDVTTLSQILNSGKVAADVKKQVGQEVKEVPKGTRKGQLSMEKFKK